MLRVGIELDGVILKYKTDKKFSLPNNEMPHAQFGEIVPGAKKALDKLHKQGYEIVIVTTRMTRAMLSSYLRNTLHLSFDRLTSQANQLSYDLYISAAGVRFDGNWTKALSAVEELLKHGTWEEKRLKGKGVTVGLHNSIKGFV